jgi:hypothetical protein
MDCSKRKMLVRLRRLMRCLNPWKSFRGTADFAAVQNLESFGFLGLHIEGKSSGKECSRSVRQTAASKARKLKLSNYCRPAEPSLPERLP